MWITGLCILWLLRSSCFEPERKDHLTCSACRGFMDHRLTRTSLDVRLEAPDCFVINGRQRCALACLPKQVLRTSTGFSSTDTILSFIAYLISYHFPVIIDLFKDFFL